MLLCFVAINEPLHHKLFSGIANLPLSKASVAILANDDATFAALSGQLRTGTHFLALTISASTRWKAFMDLAEWRPKRKPNSEVWLSRLGIRLVPTSTRDA